MDSRRFYRTVPFVLWAAAAFALWRGHRVPALVAAGIGTSLLLLRLALPSAADVFFRVWSGLLSKLGEFVTKAFMVVFFYVIFTPYGLLMRLGGDPLKRRFEPSRASYWILRPRATERDDKACENPF